MNYLLLSTPEILSVIGQRLKELRISSNYSQQAVATFIGANVQTIQKIENGQSVSFKYIIDYMKSLNIVTRLNIMFPENVLDPLTVLKFKGKERKKGGYNNETIGGVYMG
mgnify:CR=1 FL=1